MIGKDEIGGVQFNPMPDPAMFIKPFAPMFKTPSALKLPAPIALIFNAAPAETLTAPSALTLTAPSALTDVANKELNPSVPLLFILILGIAPRADPALVGNVVGGNAL